MAWAENGNEALGWGRGDNGSVWALLVGGINKEQRAVSAGIRKMATMNSVSLPYLFSNSLKQSCMRELEVGIESLGDEEFNGITCIAQFWVFGCNRKERICFGLSSRGEEMS